MVVNREVVIVSDKETVIVGEDESDARAVRTIIINITITSVVSHAPRKEPLSKAPNRLNIVF